MGSQESSKQSDWKTALEFALNSIAFVLMAITIYILVAAYKLVIS